MPNVKIFADDRVMADRRDALQAAMPGLRDLLCADLKVGVEACQLALVPVTGLPDQPQVNVELLLLPKADRDGDTVRAVAGKVRDMVAAASGAHTAVRISMLDPVTYVALK